MNKSMSSADRLLAEDFGRRRFPEDFKHGTVRLTVEETNISPSNAAGVHRRVPGVVSP